MVNIAPVTIWALIRVVFLNKWMALVTTLFTVVGILDFVDTHVAPKSESFKATWARYYVLPHWRWQTWVMVALVAVFVAGLRGTYVFARG